MGQYTNKGIYAGYDKNHKERDALDYYATPPKEVSNILQKLQLDFKENSIILEPSCGGGHMVEGILQYNTNPTILATDIKDRSNTLTKKQEQEGLGYYNWGEEFDFLSDKYPYTQNIDYVIMNPPFSLVIPFTQRALEISKKGVLMLARLKFLESQKRYEEIFKTNPPTKIFGYIDRIYCYKNGDFSVKPNAIEAYAWFWWDKNNIDKTSEFNWIWSSKK